MADQSAEPGVVVAGVEQRFEAAGGAAEIVDGAHVRGVGTHCLSLRGDAGVRLFWKHTCLSMQLI